STRNRFVSTRDDIPATLRRKAPNRVGPFVLSVHRICSVQGRVSVSSSPAMGHTCAPQSLPCMSGLAVWLFNFAMARPPESLGYYKVPTLQILVVIYSNSMRRVYHHSRPNAKQRRQNKLEAL